MVSSFLIQINVLAACFQKTGSFALHWSLARAKKLHVAGCQSHSNCTRVAASRMQHE
jgi:hypothetical protein